MLPLPVSKNKIASFLFSSSNAYAPHMGTSILSLCKNASHDYCLDIIVFDGGISEENKAIIRQLIKAHPDAHIVFFDPRTFINKDLYTEGSMSVETYYRILAPRILNDRKKILNVDADTIVLEDATKFWEVSLENKSIGVVKEYLAYDDQNQLASCHQKDGICATYKNYFNAGIILMNLERLKSNELFDSALKLASKNQFSHAEQAALNIIFSERQDEILFLPLKWNLSDAMLLFEHHRDILQNLLQPKDIGIIHYTSKKPWLEVTSFGFFYLYYLSFTPWYNELVGKETLKIRILKNIFLSRLRTRLKKIKILPF